jgi:hypothetical protein
VQADRLGEDPIVPPLQLTLFSVNKSVDPRSFYRINSPFEVVNLIPDNFGVRSRINSPFEVVNLIPDNFGVRSRRRRPILDGRLETSDLVITGCRTFPTF